MGPRVSGSTSGTSLGTFCTLGMSPRLIPPHLVGNPIRTRLPQVLLHYLPYRQNIPLGCLRIGVAIPWDDCPYGKSNDNTIFHARAYRVFGTSCVRINLGDIPRGLWHPRDVPSVDPSSLGWKPYTPSPSLMSMPHSSSGARPAGATPAAVGGSGRRRPGTRWTCPRRGRAASPSRATLTSGQTKSTGKGASIYDVRTERGEGGFPKSSKGGCVDLVL